jgi:hypothetical protein
MRPQTALVASTAAATENVTALDPKRNGASPASNHPQTASATSPAAIATPRPAGLTSPVAACAPPAGIVSSILGRRRGEVAGRGAMLDLLCPRNS